MSAIKPPGEHKQQLGGLGGDIMRYCSTDEETILCSDSIETIDILLERLRAWKHVCEYLCSYVSATAKAQKSQSLEFETILKEMVKVYSVAQGNLNDSVLPMLERLLKEIKSEAKQLKAHRSNGPHLIEKAWRATQKHIILLAKSTRSYDAGTKHKIEQSHDPYLLRQGVDSRLHEQAMKEMNDQQENQEIQESFLWFEMHILQTVQCVLAKFFQFMGGQLDHLHAMYGDILGTAQLIRPDLEWLKFVERKNASPLNPEALERSSVYTTFPNKDHRATKPIIEGNLICQSHGINEDGYYVVTRAGYLYGFGRENNLNQRLAPNLSLYLPNCSIGSVDDVEFNVRGVDLSSRNPVNPFYTTYEFIFKAQSADEAEKWHSAMDEAIRQTTLFLSAPRDAEVA
ncbi:uncharacterized protein N7496_010834 [Penicillium cataractarum]|uniref:PH domain-containing protein n=1 Tax=Penicillium cataractarum TaxID=2100454 RepID=A0A9W9UXG8_9EURO|nr:uncharacterized protein N7496_010834 [Penicillium cataractarum]KAJ5358421.1 hypothetical protein N7496_010834 [Penicillium cataractarum]